MGTLYLVRHGQASFGAEDYDQLSALGRQQSVALGRCFRQRGLLFDAVLTGTLKRHAQTWSGICEGAEWTGQNGESGESGHAARPEALLWPGLNEYDANAVIATVCPQPLATPDTPEQYRHHFRLLRDGLRQWMDGVVSPKGMPSYRDFVAGVTSALDHVRTQCSGNVLIVSSGGPIATAVGHVLGTTPETSIELNLRIRNSAVTEFTFSPKRHMLQTFNTLPHLNEPEHSGLISYA